MTGVLLGAGSTFAAFAVVLAHRNTSAWVSGLCLSLGLVLIHVAYYVEAT